MPNMRTPRGITPPAPGLEREEPTLVNEDDIPTADVGKGSRADRVTAKEDRPARSTDRE